MARPQCDTPFVEHWHHKNHDQEERDACGTELELTICKGLLGQYTTIGK
jgi:hypothetical protein